MARPPGEARSRDDTGRAVREDGPVQQTANGLVSGPASVLVRVQGSHREVGEQIGLACRDAIRRTAAITPDQLPPDRSLTDQLALSDRFRAVTAEVFPWLVTELDAAADAAEVDPRHLFAASVEEIWPGQDTNVTVPTPAFRGCTDIAGVAP